MVPKILKVFLVLLSSQLICSSALSIFDSDEDELNSQWSGTFLSFVDKNGKKFHWDEPTPPKPPSSVEILSHNKPAEIDIVRKTRSASQLEEFAAKLGAMDLNDMLPTTTKDDIFNKFQKDDFQLSPPLLPKSNPDDHDGDGNALEDIL